LSHAVARSVPKTWTSLIAKPCAWKALREGDIRGLRMIARADLNNGDMAAIKELADRLDGKPAQESTVSINDVRDNMTDAELRTFIATQ
jgi:hypothetical protein